MSRTRDAEAELNLPPGFRFHPTDEELVVHYLCRKAAGQCQPVPIIAEIDLYKFDPWELPAKALFGKKEWYFFTPRERKYPNGSRPNRAAGTGYWKATGADKPISPQSGNTTAGIKKALVFYAGKAPQGIKTDWEKMQPKEEKSSLVETMDLAYDTVSDSFRTQESDVENDSALPNISDLFCTTQAVTGPQQALSTCNEDGLQMVHRSQKEDSEWFMDLKLEDLQTSCMSFGLPVPITDAANQDHNSQLLVPSAPRPSFTKLLPFLGFVCLISCIMEEDRCFSERRAAFSRYFMEETSLFL